MKKLLLIGVLSAGVMMFSSCGMGGTSLKSKSDSVSYAIGQSLGEMAYNFDSTAFDIKIVNAAIRDVYAKKQAFTQEQVQAIMNDFAMGKRAEEQKAEIAKFSKDSADNVVASKAYLEKKEKEGFTKTASGLLYKIEKEGTAPKAMFGDTLSVHYTLTLPSGEKKESSRDHGQPMKFPYAEGNMIKGFNEGMALFGKGGKGTIIVPAELGYGSNRGAGPGPALALTFEIEMVDIIKPVKK